RIGKYDKKYVKNLHPHFSRIADLSFTNWLVIIIAPLLVFLDTIIWRRKLVIGHYLSSFGWAAAFGARTNRMVLAMGSDLLIEPFTFWRLTIVVALRRARALLVDNYLGHRIAIQLGFKGESTIIPFGIKIPDELYDLRDKLIKKEEIIFWIRGFNPIYNIECFLEALKILSEEKIMKQWKVIMGGPGKLTSKMKKIISDPRLENKVTNIGYINDRAELLRLFEESTIYVTASFSDGTSVALLEAMAYGLSLVVSDIPNNRYWVKEEKNGYIFDPNDSQKLASILKSLITGGITVDERIKLSKHSFSRVKRNGSIESFSKKLDMLIQHSMK
ncbi:MAG: glycosyltransferase family 4 protein, partial [Candidatus Hodarchaeales archaeon]